MKSIENLRKGVSLSSNKMSFIKAGGGRKPVKMEFKSDGEGTYLELTYDDGSVEYIAHSWYA